MSAVRVVSVVGARPQFIKAAVVEQALREAGADVLGVHTGQHYDHDMSKVFFDELRIHEPVANLGVGSGSHGQQTADALSRLEPVLLDLRPDIVVVYGDTNSTLAAAVAAAKLGLPVAHVEAGLRSFDRRMPEEQNRIVADHLADLLFTPSDSAYRQLEKEGLGDRAVVVGDVMRDAHRLVRDRVDPAATAAAFGVPVGGFVLATIHRAANTDQAARLAALLEGLGRSAVPVLLPLHPRTRARLDGRALPSRVQVVAPVGFRDMVALEAACDRVATDSGGVQKEALWSGVPCVTLRDETEWVETVESGWNTLTGTDVDRIAAALAAPPPTAPPPDLYGDGFAGRRIAAHILEATG